MHQLFKDKEHLARLAGLLIAAFVLFVVLRGLAIPKGFGELGHYRTGALADNMARTPAFAGTPACLECHTDVGPKLKAGKHAKVRCEACHGALGVHASDPSKLTPIRPEPKKLCLVCHQKNVARPAKHPQVDAREHGDGASCVECHGQHNPGAGPDPSPVKPAAGAAVAPAAAAAAPAPAAKESAK